MNRKELYVISVSAIIIVTIIVTMGIYLFKDQKGLDPKNPVQKTSGTSSIEKIDSEAHFFEITNSNNDQYNIDPSVDFIDGFSPISSESIADYRYEDNISIRHSNTNTQVLTIDEADIVKTDGKNIYYSKEPYRYYPTPMPLEETFNDDYPFSIEPYENESLTSIISAFPPTEMGVLSELDSSGKLYLVNKTLIVENFGDYTSYDISDPTNPEKLWEYMVDEEVNIISSRVFNGELYVVLGKSIYTTSPCDGPLLRNNDVETVTLSCTDIYYPTSSQTYDQTFTVLKIDVSSGRVIDKTSFLASQYNSILYMSENYIYITYPNQSNEFELLVNFVEENNDLFSENYLVRIDNLQSYDISDSAKLEEFKVLTEKFLAGLDELSRLEVESNIYNRMNDYSDDHIRDFYGTGIVKIGNTSMKIVANGSVPGNPLDQFSLDEYNGYLRIATNINPYYSGLYYFGNRNDLTSRDSKDENDIIVLNEDLESIGEVRGLGVGEDIYSARFIGDSAYLVTFRQIDPFYVVDLSIPSDPLVQGELKIPGYSSYLHPLSKNLILGVGQEDFRVKLSLFDVSDPTRPIELSKYSLSENWTEVSENHHAFLHDLEHQIFFLPAGESGYVISYEGNRLELEKAFADNIQRALYINDYMYTISPTQIAVYDENDWSKVSQLDLVTKIP